MRVIAGWLGGRTFATPRGHRTHPMSDKMRGALFSALGDIKGLTALDAFSGSGGLAIEAVSRGAKSVIAVEADKAAQTVIQQNIQSLEVEDRVKAVRSYMNAWSNRNHNQSFDLVFADPPYDNIPYKDVRRLTGHLADGGTLVLSWPGKMEHLTLEGLHVVHNKNFGDSQLVFYQKIS